MRRSTLVIVALAFCSFFLLAPSCPPKSRDVQLGVAGYWPPGATPGPDGAPSGGSPEAWFSAVSLNADHYGMHVTYGALFDQLTALATQRPAVVVTDLKTLNVSDACVQCLSEQGRILSACLQPELNPCLSTELMPYVGQIHRVLVSGDPAVEDPPKPATGPYADRIKAWCVGNELDQEPIRTAVLADTLLAEIQSRAPSIQTCVVFQHQRARLGSDEEVITRLREYGRASVLVLTDYPNVVFSETSPGYAIAAEVPKDYYARPQLWASQTGKKLAIGEFGWQTTRTQRRPWVGGDPVVADGVVEQGRIYVRMMAEQGFRPPLVFFNHAFFFDLAPPGQTNPYAQGFDKMGLCRWDDPQMQACRPAAATWRQAYDLPYHQP